MLLRLLFKREKKWAKQKRLDYKLFGNSIKLTKNLNELKN